MRQGIVLAGALALAPAASAQQFPPEKEAPAVEAVTVTAEKRQDTLQQQQAAERAAADARREFASLKKGGGDLSAACRKSDLADHEYAQAISEAQALLRDAQQPKLKARLEQRIDGMKERRDNLGDMRDRVCRGNGLAGRKRGGRGNGRLP